MIIYIFFLLITLSSCTSREKTVHALESWKGLNVSEIDKHPYFKNLKVIKVKHEKSPDTWIYKDQTPFQTGAYCQSLGGCLGMPSYNCENAFSVENDVIIDLERKGTCPGPRVIEATKK